MKTKSIARGSATRTANKNKRREHILACAGDIIAKQGFDALTLQDLAHDANVTIPTIHNLIGRKSQIYERLVDDVIVKVSEVLARQEETDPLLAAEAFIDQLIALYATNENMYKAAFVAGERAKLFEHKNPNGIFARSLALSAKVCENGKTQGFLEGRISSDKLARQIFACQRLARQDWTSGYIDLETYRAQVLIGMFMTFAADANPGFHKRLMNKIRALRV